MSAASLLRISSLPVLQNKVYASADVARACTRGDIDLVQDDATGVVCNRAFDPGRIHYDTDYQNEQGCSDVFQEHLHLVLQILGSRFATQPVIEVGCGKGKFLGLLRDAGFDATGVDPAYEGTSAHVVRAPFSESLGLPRAGLIVLRHVLEHVQQPLAFLRAIARANGGGMIYIEVPCFEWILRRRAWFDIFYEHVNYFRPADFSRMFGRIDASGHLFGGQYQYVIADLSTLQDPGPGDDPVEIGPRFMAGLDHCAELARSVSGPKALWGASSKGVIFAHHLQQVGVELDVAVDINPVKQGRFMAGTGMPIVSPASALQQLPEGALVFVMNSNYLGEIAAQSGGRFRLEQVDQENEV
ncbi:MAG: class I SAM-dependent methyltransferase [Pseudomonadota bacterium]|nr:class I SAM-dependent methyltransferase [Pseudomonadota bacterium]